MKKVGDIIQDERKYWRIIHEEMGSYFVVKCTKTGWDIRDKNGDMTMAYIKVSDVMPK
jgi:RNA-binding protein YlmH